MACPHVAGLAVRMRSRVAQPIRNVRLKGNQGVSSGILTPSDILQMMLLGSVESIPGRFDTRTYPLVRVP
jgi:hypothetical protein